MLGSAHVVEHINCRMREGVVRVDLGDQGREDGVDDGLVHPVDSVLHERGRDCGVDDRPVFCGAQGSDNVNHRSIVLRKGALQSCWPGAVVGPVCMTMAANVLRIVGAEHDDDNVPFVFSERRVLWALPVGAVPLLQHGRTTGSEVGHLVAITEHDLELSRVGVVASCTVRPGSDRVTDTPNKELIRTVLRPLRALQGEFIPTLHRLRAVGVPGHIQKRIHRETIVCGTANCKEREAKGLHCLFR